MNEPHQTIYARLMELKARTPWTHWPEELRRALQHSARRLAEGLHTPAFPPVLYIEPTNACNCNCRICPRQNMTRPVGMMDLNLYRRIVDSAASMGPSELHLFNFGEPMLHPELEEMVRYGTQNKLKVRFQTNGLLVEEERILRLLEAGLGYIGVSVNGLTAQEYETIRPGHSFQRLLGNLQRLRAAIDRSGRSCTLHVAAQILKEESADRGADIEIFKKTWFSLADSLSIFGLSKYDGISIMQQGQETESLLAKQKRKPDENILCAEPFDRLVVKWDGQATVCCVDYDASLVVGDLQRQSLAEVWHSPALEAIRDAVRQRKYAQIPLCRSCPKFYSEPFTLFLQKTVKPIPAPIFQ